MIRVLALFILGFMLASICHQSWLRFPVATFWVAYLLTGLLLQVVWFKFVCWVFL